MLCEQNPDRQAEQPTASAENEAGAPDTSEEEPRAWLAEGAGETVGRQAKALGRSLDLLLGR